MTFIRSRFLFGALIVLILFIESSCRKLVVISDPPGGVFESNVYTNDATAISVLTAIYSSMGASGGVITGSKSFSIYLGLAADEFTLYGGAIANDLIGYYKNILSATVTPLSGSETWSPLYNYVFKCNAAIEGLQSSNAEKLTPIVRQQLLGEIKFMRAYFYFYLVNLFGDVPLALTTDPKFNTGLARDPKSQVYEHIIKDLTDAQELLSTDYLNETLLSTTVERIRPSKWVATALLARIYLYTGDWANAETQASLLINNTTLFGLSNLNNAFLKASLGNMEAIWQLQPTAQAGANTLEAPLFIMTSTGPVSSRPVYLSNYLLNSFESGDLRAKYKNWIDTITVLGVTYRYPYKYKINAIDASITAATGSKNMKEFLMLFRLGEQYLIRAEARAQQGNIPGAQSDLNAIRKRAGLNSNTTTDKNVILTDILHERQVELFTEFGHRWLDLKRVGKIDTVMQTVTPSKNNGNAWQSHQQLFPISATELTRAPNLDQNLGY